MTYKQFLPVVMFCALQQYCLEGTRSWPLAPKQKKLGASIINWLLQKLREISSEKGCFDSLLQNVSGALLYSTGLPFT